MLSLCRFFTPLLVIVFGSPHSVGVALEDDRELDPGLAVAQVVTVGATPTLVGQSIPEKCLDFNYTYFLETIGTGSINYKNKLLFFFDRQTKIFIKHSLAINFIKDIF